MVHLHKDKSFKTKLGGLGSGMGDEGSSLENLLGDDFSFASEPPSSYEDDFTTPSDLDEESSPPVADTIESFAHEVLRKIEEDNTPPTPNSFQLYFERLLEEKPDGFKKSIVNILELEDSSDDERRIDLEKRIKDSFKNMKNILQHVAVLYKNLNLMQNIVQKRLEDAKKSDNPMVLQSVLNLFLQEVEKLNSITKKQTLQLKEFYQDSARIVNSIDNETIFDSQFGIYNRRHLLSQIDREIKIIGQFGHSSTILLARFPDSKIRKIPSEKALLLVMRTISRLILKTSRRSDIIAHYGGGTFAMILKHSDLFSSKKACDRLADLIQTTSIFIGETELNLGIAIGIAKILPHRKAEETLNLALNAMEAANLAQIPYAVCREDEE